ncbi:FKBP-type peptidyl-prolyl cis-trans isomerase [Flavobacterium sp. GP15]|uniref:FKBP-type peptidyl-prolyl cis-trans isomerase n=1 Tax=Flavobacterium sp. GP15 TaxID=2758567 RepID=UPI00165DC31D|nr:FKBP-type peptidyl-prolyl cis-trans isomerase [Flavobacterium sp. GP15]
MKYTLFALIFILFISCSKEKEVDYTAKNEKEIVAYIAKNKLNAHRSTSGLYYVINELGTGAQPNANSTVTVAYKGYFTDGSPFDESKPEGISFGLQQVIKGWTEGIAYFKEGGSGVLLVPSNLGYGSEGRSGIPGGSVLIFDVKLISVQ